jgi:hypothetical protein
MSLVRILCWIVVIVIGANLVNVAMHSGLGHGAGLDTFLGGVADPWQLMINTDLIAGLLLMIGWMIYRERRAPLVQRIAWAWTAAWWGNIVIAVYVLRLARRPGQDLSNLLVGGRPEHVPHLAVPARLAALAAALLLLAYLIRELMTPGLALIGVAGYLAGLAPLILSLALMAKGPSPPAPG